MKRRAMMGKEQYKPDANTLLLLHGEDFNDSSMYVRSISNSGVTINKTGKFGKCFKFISDNYITTSITISKANTFTIDAWVKVSSISSIQTFFATGTREEGLQVRADGANLEILKENALILGIATNVINPGNWFHLAITNTSNIKAYINGIKVIECRSDFLTYSTLAIGIRGELNGEYLQNGYIDEFRVSDIARWTSDFTPPTKPYV